MQIYSSHDVRGFTAEHHFTELPPGSLLLEGLTILIPSTAA